MTEAAAISASGLNAVADRALRASAGIWFLAAVGGQWIFFYYLATFYGASTVSGNFQAWNRNTFLFMGYVAGDAAGNLFFAAHALLAGIVSLGGALQLVPQIRARAISLHRWNGRLFLLSALAAGAAGLYLVWVRGDRPNAGHALALSLNAVLIMVFVVSTWRSALAGKIAAHRRWGLRTWLVANAQWFIRVGTFAWIILMQGPVGMTDDSDGPFNVFADFGCYLLPLVVLELYMRAKDGAAPRGRLAMAGFLFALTVLMSIGIVGVSAFVW